VQTHQSQAIRLGTWQLEVHPVAPVIGGDLFCRRQCIRQCICLHFQTAEHLALSFPTVSLARLLPEAGKNYMLGSDRFSITY